MSANLWVARKRSFEEPSSPFSSCYLPLNKRSRFSPSSQINSQMGGQDSTAELFVREMTSAISLDDARARARRGLESFEKSITERVVAEFAAYKENMILKEQELAAHKENVSLKEEQLLREIGILKKGVAIQHERIDSKDREIYELKQLLAQQERQKDIDRKEQLKSQEQIRNLEVKNYALMVHLQQAQQQSPIPSRSNRDLF